MMQLGQNDGSKRIDEQHNLQKKSNLVKATSIVLLILALFLVAGCSAGAAPPKETTPTPLPLDVKTAEDPPIATPAEPDLTPADVPNEPPPTAVQDLPPEEEPVVDSLMLRVEELFPVKVSATIGGNLPDDCTEISGWEQDINENMLYVRSLTTRTEGEGCSNSQVRFEQNIDLDVFGLSAGEISNGGYILDINGWTTDLSLALAGSLLDEELTGCAVGGESETLYLDEEGGFCLLYPDSFEMRNDEAPNVVGFYGPALDDHEFEPLRAILYVNYREPAMGRTLEQIAEERRARYADTDRELIITPAFLDGQHAILVEGEGEMAITLQIITIHEDIIYAISVLPYDNFPQAADDVELAWDLALNSFKFIRPPVSQEDGQIISLVEFEGLLKEAITSHNYDWLQALMDESFGFAFWLSEGYETTPEGAIEQLRLNYLQTDHTITFEDTLPDLSANLGEDRDILSIWNPATNPIGALFSTGWGPDGNSEAILIVVQSPDGILAWDGIILAHGEMGGFSGTGNGGG